MALDKKKKITRKPTRAKETPEFIWKGKDKKGYEMKGTLYAANVNLAKAIIAKQGIKVTKIKKKPKDLFGGKKKIKPLDIAFFSRQMATMMQAGVAIIMSLEMIIKGTDHGGIKKLSEDLKEQLEGGSNFSDALKSHPDQFDKLYCSLVYAGEQSGTLEVMLGRIATYKEKTESIKKKIKKALTYPIAILIIAFAVTVILLVFVVPTFEELFSGFGAELPAFTRFVLDLSRWMQAYWYIMIVGIVAFIIVFKQIKKRSLKFREFLDKLSLNLPIVGTILNKSCIARFTRTLSTTFAAGMPLVDALTSVSTATGNLGYEYAALRIRDEIISGTNIKDAVQHTGRFPPMVEQMIAIGEESGRLDEMLAKVADIYEEDVDLAVDNLSSLLEPAIMVILGVLVGGLVTAMYMPIFEMGSVV